MANGQKRGANGSTTARTISDSGLRNGRNQRKFDAAGVYDKIFGAIDIATHPISHLRNISPHARGLIIAAGLAFPAGVIFQAQTNVIPKFEGPSAGVSLQQETFHAWDNSESIHSKRIDWTQDAFDTLLVSEGKAYISDALHDSAKQENVGKAFDSYFAAVQKINSGELAKDSVLQMQIRADIEAFNQYLGQPGAHSDDTVKELVDKVADVSAKIQTNLEDNFGSSFPELDYATYVSTVNALQQKGPNLPGPGG